MKTKKIIYWATTVLASIPFLMGGFMDITHHPDMIKGFQHLGYPENLLTFLGVAKLLGVIALLVPRFPRLKEWAYAGLTFDLLGAAWAHGSVGDPIIALIAILFLLGVSYVFYLMTAPAKTFHLSHSGNSVLQFN